MGDTEKQIISGRTKVVSNGQVHVAGRHETLFVRLDGLEVGT